MTPEYDLKKHCGCENETNLPDSLLGNMGVEDRIPVRHRLCVAIDTRDHYSFAAL